MDVKGESCPIQDEPEAAMCFQHKMSLKEGRTGHAGG